MEPFHRELQFSFKKPKLGWVLFQALFNGNLPGDIGELCIRPHKSYSQWKCQSSTPRCTGKVSNASSTSFCLYLTNCTQLNIQLFITAKRKTLFYWVTNFLSGYQSFPISLHLTRDVVEHTCCTHTTLYVFQLQINYKSIAVFSDFTQDERNINSLAHENAYKPWLLPWEKATEKMFSWSNSLLIAVSNAPKSQLQWYSNKSLWLRLRLIFLDHEETKCSLPSWLTLEAKEIQAVS